MIEIGPNLVETIKFIVGALVGVYVVYIIYKYMDE